MWLMCPMRTLSSSRFPPPPSPETRYVMTSGGSKQWLTAPTNRHEILPLKKSSDSYHPQLSLLPCTSHFILSSLGLSFRNHTFVAQRPVVSHPLYPRSCNTYTAPFIKACAMERTRVNVGRGGRVHTYHRRRLVNSDLGPTLMYPFAVTASAVNRHPLFPT
jgi:hypothetical protein